MTDNNKVRKVKATHSSKLPSQSDQLSNIVNTTSTIQNNLTSDNDNYNFNNNLDITTTIIASSSSLSLAATNSDEKIITITEFDTQMINVVFGWCEKYCGQKLFYHNTKRKKKLCFF